MKSESISPKVYASAINTLATVKQSYKSFEILTAFIGYYPEEANRVMKEMFMGASEEKSNPVFNVVPVTTVAESKPMQNVVSSIDKPKVIKPHYALNAKAPHYAWIEVESAIDLFNNNIHPSKISKFLNDTYHQGANVRSPHAVLIKLNTVKGVKGYTPITKHISYVGLTALRNNKPNNKRPLKRYSTAETLLVIQKHKEGMDDYDIAKVINERFNTDRTELSIYNRIHYMTKRKK